MEHKKIYDIIKYTYFCISILILGFIIGLISCQDSYNGYYLSPEKKCSFYLEIIIISLFSINTVIIILYNIYNKCCSPDIIDEEQYITI